MNPSAANDLLTYRGEMLRDMNIVNNSNNSTVIGFTDPVQARKAFWLNVSGVGRSRKLWKFLGLRKEQTGMLIKKFEKDITKEVTLELYNKILKIK